jgi:hypothetical protein
MGLTPTPQNEIPTFAISFCKTFWGAPTSTVTIAYNLNKRLFYYTTNLSKWQQYAKIILPTYLLDDENKRPSWRQKQKDDVSNPYKLSIERVDGYYSMTIDQTTATIAPTKMKEVQRVDEGNDSKQKCRLIKGVDNGSKTKTKTTINHSQCLRWIG